jgi:hypothetical protein
MWRGWRVFVPVVIANALIQAGISVFPYSPDQVGLNLLTSVVSAAVLWVTVAFVTATAHIVPYRRVGWPDVTSLLRRNGLRFSLWLVLLVFVASTGLAVFTLPGILVVALTPFVLLASVAGEANPLRVNFTVIRSRFWRWLVTAVIGVILVLLGYVVLGFTEFFLRGPLGATVILVVVGFVTAWVMTAWALILVSVRPAPEATP